MINLQPGWMKKEMVIISSGRQTGKSYYQKMMLNQLYNTNLCKEITLTGQQKLMELTSIWGQPMKEEKYKFSRNWFEEHLFFKSWEPIQQRLDWCEEVFGPQPKNPDAWTRWYTMHTLLRFRDKKDYEWFILKWGQ